ncbi:MAG: GAF domain-containing SpoIIE family protein phosphatase [bacterium]
MDSLKSDNTKETASGRAWIERRAYTELMEVLNSARQELQALASGNLPDSRLSAFDDQLQRFARILEQIQEVQRDRLELHLVTQIAESLSNALDLEEVLTLIIDSLKQVVDYDAVGIFLISEDGSSVEGEWLRGYDVEGMKLVRQKLDQGLVGVAIATRKPVIVADVKNDPRYFDTRSQTQSELVAPMFTSGKVIGCFNLESDRLGAFSEADAERLAAFASQAAIAIDRARMHREIVQKQRLDEQLALARRMQRDLLPRKAPLYDRFDMAGINVPSEAVGGDYFDFIPLTQKDLGFVIGDVSGKGVPAAFVMASLRAALRIEAFSHYAISTILSRVNDFLAESTKPEIFVTAFYGVLDTQTAALTFANAGHNPPLLIRADGTLTELSEGGMLLGAFPAALYHEHRTNLQPGDVLLLYTDGASEAMNPAGEEFGIIKLEEVVRKILPAPSKIIIREILKTIRTHTGSTRLQDDITLMVIQCR